MDDLKALWQQVAEKKIAEVKYRELQTQRKAVSARLRELEKIKLAEQADVDRLERRSLAAFFYQMAGRMDEKLDKERQEAGAARVRYDAAARELASIDADMARLEAQLKRLSDCERCYQEALVKRVWEIRESSSPAAQELMESETRITAIQLRQKEIQEAVQAGKAALHKTDEILASLEDAEGCGCWDIMGGGMLADWVKYDHLDSAQEQVEQLQVELRRFKTELADVEIDADLQVTVDGFLRFADFFFDNLFTDWEVLEHIDQAQSQVKETRRQIRRLLAKLDRTSADLKSQMEDECEKREQIALEAEV